MQTATRQTVDMTTSESTMSETSEHHTASSTATDNSATEAKDRTVYPVIKQYKQFTKDNNWLYCNKGRLGCSVCCETSNSNAT